MVSKATRQAISEAMLTALYLDHRKQDVPTRTELKYRHLRSRRLNDLRSRLSALYFMVCIKPEVKKGLPPRQRTPLDRARLAMDLTCPELLLEELRLVLASGEYVRVERKRPKKES
jgi:hypothetical protein